MNSRQTSITIAYVIVAGAVIGRSASLNTIFTWAKTPPKAKQGP